MPGPILGFLLLQLLDVATTLAFLWHGVEEGNPLVRLAITLTANPLAGLALVKVGALALGAFCWQTGRTRLLTRANVFFAALVAWNITAILVQRSQG